MTKRKDPPRRILKPDLDVLRRQCEVEHIPIEDLRRQYGYSHVSNLYVYCQKWGIKPYRHPRPTDYLRTLDLSPEQHQIVAGTLLGDGHIRVRANDISRHTGLRYTRKTPGYQLIISQGQKQRAYLEWKKRRLEPFIVAAEPYAKEQRGYGVGSMLYDYHTVSHPAFAEYRRVFYPDGTKRITEDALGRLGPLALAVWLMDDGSFHRGRNYIHISTNSFTRAELELAAEWFGNLLGRAPYIHSAGRANQFSLAFNRLASDALRPLVREHFFEPLLYKIGL